MLHVLRQLLPSVCFFSDAVAAIKARDAIAAIKASDTIAAVKASDAIAAIKKASDTIAAKPAIQSLCAPGQKTPAESAIQSLYVYVVYMSCMFV